jgi:hypothetical protein
MNIVNRRQWMVVQGTAILLVVLAVVAGGYASKKKAQNQEPTAVLSIVVLKDDNGRPVRNAGVVLHLVNEKDKQEKGGLELKTDADGKCSMDGIPYGKVRVQVLASGFQTFGEDYDVSQPTMSITIKLKRPGELYSIYENHPTGEKPKPEEAPKSPPQPK